MTAEQLAAADDDAARQAASAASQIELAPDNHEQADAAVAPDDSSSLQQRRRRRTPSSTRSSRTPVVSAATVQSAPSQQYYQTDQGQQYYRPQLAMVVTSASLPAEGVLRAVQPLLESPSWPKVMFETKRCYNELRHWGIHMEGEFVWCEEGAAVVECLDPAANGSATFVCSGQ